MKRLFLISALILTFSLSFGQRVLTQAEKQSLQESSVFIEKCKQSVRDFAVFWSTNDGSSANTEALRITWAKNRILSINVLVYDINDPLIAYRFLNAAKGKEFTLGTAPQPVNTLITAWDTENSFEEFSASYFALKGDDINFSIGN